MTALLTGLDPATIHALNQPHVTAVYALKLDLVSGISRIHSGLGPLVIGGETYKLPVALGGLDDSLLAEVMRERIVDRMAWLYLVVMGPDGAPLNACLQFKGRIAQTPVKAGKTNTIQLTISNIFEDWQRGLNLRNTDESHRRLYPDDHFFRYQSQMADRSIFWGSVKDAPGFVYED